MKPNSTSGAGVPTGRPPNDPGLIRLLAETIENEASFACDAGGLLYIYRDGVYVPEAERYVKQAVIYYLKAWNDTKRWSSHLSAETIAFLATCAPTLYERPPLTHVNLANGILELQSRTLQPHTPSYLSTVRLPVFYDPAAVDCPTWCAFLERVLSRDVNEAGLIWSLLGLLMTPSTDAHQAFLISGPGGNGKGAFLAAIRAFLGERNVSSLNLDQITGERFAAAHLYGKLANLCDDLSSRHLGDTATFKRIVGGDPITADRKHREPITFRPFARLIFSANEYPQSADSSNGFYDRWVVIPFIQEFRGQGGELPRHVLDGRLSAPCELSGVLNRALAALPARRLPMTDSMRLAWEEFRGSTDWVLIWLERMLVEHATGVIEKKAIHQALVNEAQRQRRAMPSPTALYRRIRQRWPHVVDSQRRLDPAHNSVECFVGLAWRTGVPPV